MSSQRPPSRITSFWRPVLLFCFASAALLGAGGVALGALAAHLPDNLFSSPQGREHLNIAASIALWHAGVILSLCLVINFGYLRFSQSHMILPICVLPTVGMTTGTWLFTLPISLQTLGYASGIGLAPVGGSLLIISWLGLLFLCPLLFKEYQ